jgi:hypothetical protein
MGRPTFAAQFTERGLIDQYRFVVDMVVLGPGSPSLARRVADR